MVDAIGAALLIGNARYQSAFPQLRTPLSDVANLGDRFERLGFEVRVVKDATRVETTAALADFEHLVAKLGPATSVFVYFAGHGIQRNGENYLVPIDAPGFEEKALIWSCCKLSDILTAICGRPDQQKLVALDACRSNRVPSSTRDGGQGLTSVSIGRYEGLRDVIVLFSTEPGQVALDGASQGASPFCRALLDGLEDPSRSIGSLAEHVTDYVCQLTQEMQVPWMTGTIRRRRPFAIEEGAVTQPGPGTKSRPLFPKGSADEQLQISMRMIRSTYRTNGRILKSLKQLVKRVGIDTLESAGERGSVDALMLLMTYEHQISKNNDDNAKAIYYLMKAAELQDSEAMALFSCAYNDVILPADAAKSMQLLNTACELRNPIAYLELSSAHAMERFGLKRDREKQMQILEIAISLGSEVAKYELSELITWPSATTSEEEYSRAKKLRESAAMINWHDSGVINAKIKVARLMRYDEPDVQDFGKAKKILHEVIADEDATSLEIETANEALSRFENL